MAIDTRARGMAATAQKQIIDATVHNKGYFATLLELQTAHPIGVVGDYAIVGTTDTIWVWDDVSLAWVDTQHTPVLNADEVIYDNSTSGLEAAEVQAAIDEIVSLQSQVIANIEIDGNRTDSYIEDGSEIRPFKTLGAAITAMSASSAAGFSVNIAYATYTESGDLTLPNKPITVYGNNSIISNSGHTITIPNPYFIRYNLFTNSNVVYDNFSAGARCIVQGGGIVGNVTINSYVEMTMCQLSGGTVSVGATGQLFVTICSPTSVFTSAGVLFMERVNINTGKHSNYLIESTAGFLSVSNSLLTNLYEGGCISCNNGATTTPNILANNYIIAYAGNALNLGTAAVAYSKNFIVGAVSGGVGIIPVNSDAIGGGTIMGLGSDATGDIYYRAATGVLTRLGIGTEGQVLSVSSGGLPYWKTL